MTEAILGKKTDKLPTGIVQINEKFGLVTLKTIGIEKSKKQHNGKHSIYKIKVDSEHPFYGNMGFSFEYIPDKKQTNGNFYNIKDEMICAGTSPKGEIKDIIIAGITEESYAYQFALKRTTWCHAERNPENGEYLLWHYIYYGKYSPRLLSWKLPKKCFDEKLYEKHKCKLCHSQKCEYIKNKCSVCGQNCENKCPKCKDNVCKKHSHCNNGHMLLTDKGAFRGTCLSCGRKVPIEEKECCKQKEFRRF